MQWLSFSEARTYAQGLYRPFDLPPQMISVAADLVELYREIPILPELISSSEGPPAPIHQWYCRIGNRVVTIECFVDVRLESFRGVVLYTPFLEEPKELGDWTILLELQDLPKSIYVTRPFLVESRNVDSNWVVYRPDPQGWNTVLYKAASRTEAESFLAFLRQDQWNRACFIGEPEPPGQWATIQGEEVIVGSGAELNSALRFACGWSLQYAPIVLLVKDMSGINKDVYVVSQGHVEKKRGRD